MARGNRELPVVRRWAIPLADISKVEAGMGKEEGRDEAWEAGRGAVV